MKQLLQIACVVALLLPALGGLTATQAQTITTGAATPASFCAGSAVAVSVPFSTSGSFGAGTLFTAQLSGSTGSFAAPVTLGTLTASPTSATTLTINGTIPATVSDGTGYRVRVISATPASGTVVASSVVGSLSSTTMVGSRPAAPVVSGGVGPYCQGAAVTALVVTGQNTRFYNAAGQLLSAGPSISTTTPGTLTFSVTQTVNGCESARTPVSIVVNPLPTVPTVVSPVVLCQGATAQPLSASPAPAGNTLRWYGTSQTGGTASSTPNTPGNQASATYYVSQVDANGCEGNRAPIAVTVNPLPAGPTITAVAPLCQNATAQPLSASGQNVRWFSQSGAVLPGTPTPSTTTPGSVTYLAAQIVNGCETPVANRSVIVITVNPSPGPPTVSGALAYCVGNTAAPLSATSTGGATLIWYGRAATGGTGSGTPTVPATTAAESGQTINYYLSQQLSGCESTRASIAVQVKPVPGVPTVSPIVLCQNATPPVTLATPTGGASLVWYGQSSTGGTASTVAPVISTAAATNYTLYVSQTLNGCEGVRTALAVTINALPAAPAVSASFAVCQGTAPAVLSATGQGIRWYNQAGQPILGTPVPPTTTPGSLTYTAAQTINGCETPAAQRAAVVVTVNLTPAAPAVVGSVSYCVGNTAAPLSATPMGGATLLWYGRTATGGTGSDTPTVPATTAAESGQTINYYVSQQLSGCEGTRASIAVQVKPVPAAPTVGTTEFCQGSSPVALVATATGGAALLWYGQNQTGGTPSTTAPTVSNATPGVFSYYVSQTLNGCESAGRALTTIEVKPTPAPPGVTPVFYCQRQQDQPEQVVLPFAASGQNLQWYNLDGNKFPTAPTVNIDNVSVTTVQVTQASRGCESGKAAATITVRTTPPPVPTQTAVVYCRTDRAVPLAASSEGGASLRWIDPNGNITGEAPTPLTLNATKPGGEFFYVYQIGANGCYSSRASIRLTINTVPTLSIVGPAGPVNLGLLAPLQLRFTSIPPFTYTLNDGTSGIAQDTLTTISVRPARTFVYQVASVSNVCGVGLPGNPATATVTVVSPIITTGAINVGTVCAGGSISVPFTTSGTFNPGNVFIVQLADTVSKQYVDLATNVTASPVSITIPANAVGGPSFVRVVGTNPGIQVNGSTSLVNVRPRPLATLSGSQTIFEGGTATLSVSLTGDGPWSLVYTDSLRTVPLTATTNPFPFQVIPARTSTYRLQSVSNACGVGTVAGVATVRVVTALGLADPLAESVRTYPVPVTTVLMVDIDQPVAAGGVVLTLTDLTGRTVISQTTRMARTELDLATRPSGLYLLKIQVGDRQTVRRIVKE